MHSKKSSLYTVNKEMRRPRFLKLPIRIIKSSEHSKEDHTPHFQNSSIEFKSPHSYTNLQTNNPKPPKHLPPLLPLMHSPKVLGNFIFKTPKSKSEDFVATFRIKIPK